MFVKICMLAFSHSAFDARVLFKESVSLQRNGFEVTLLSPCDEKRGLMDPSAHRYLGIDRTEHEGVRIIGVRKRRGPLWVFHNIINFYTKALEVNADVYHCQEGDVSALVGILVKRKMRKMGREIKLVFDVHEYWPGAFARMFISRIMKRISMFLFKIWENIAVRHADLVFTANQIVRGHFLLMDRFSKVEVLYNCPRLDLVMPRKEKEGDLVLCHEGNLYFRRGLKSLIESVAIMKSEDMPVKLLIIGEVFGKEKEYLDKKIKDHSLHDMIEITGWLPYPEVGKHIARADLGLILFEPTMNNMLAGPPNKLFNYMSSGLCVLSVDLPETERIIRDRNCGMILRRLDPNDIAEAVRHVLDDRSLMAERGQNGIKAVIDQYNWGKMEEKLINRYEEMLKTDNKVDRA